MLTTQIGKETVASDTIKYDKLASGAVAKQIAADYFDFKFGALLDVPSTNTAPIYIGDSTVTIGTGFPLIPGSSIILPVKELRGVFIISAIAQNLNWLGY